MAQGQAHSLGSTCVDQERGRMVPWTLAGVAQILVYFGVLFVAFDILPNAVWDPDLRHVTILIGALGVWRYGWWMTHAARAFIYGRFVFPKLRQRADIVWGAGWRPRHVHFLITTFKEHPDTTRWMLESVCREIHDSGLQASIWIGTRESGDEKIVEDYFRTEWEHLHSEVVLVRQNVPGKRSAIGLVLRAINRSLLRPDDLVVLMDGDTVLGRGALVQCAALFGALPDVQAVTTDERVICFGPTWLKRWLEMRFAQRRLAMQSHALSRRVLTLTGRMSAFRAKELLTEDFVRQIEVDYLEHWLWGRFRFLSGDDKSTWYHLLKKRAAMLYVPDALVFTVERVEQAPFRRVRENLKRWAGNMLRNGQRAIDLGPRRMPIFIWWCLVDQRLSIWTMLVSPTVAITAAIMHSWNFIISYILWIALSRMLLSLALYGQAGHVRLSYPFLLYANQLTTAIVKVYTLFHLAQQRWANRGDQRMGFTFGTSSQRLRRLMGDYLTVLYPSLLVLFTALYVGLVDPPSTYMLGILLP